MKDNVPYKGKYITQIKYVAGVGVLTVGYKNVDSVSVGDDATATMDGWLFKITPSGSYGVDTYELDGTDSRVELNPAELVNGHIYIPASGKILSWAVSGASTTGAILATLNGNTQMGYVGTSYGKIVENTSIQNKYIGCELTLLNNIGGTDYANPDLKALEDRIKALEEKWRVKNEE